MAFPVGLLEWEPNSAVGHTIRVIGISEDGAADVDNQSNYHIYRWNSNDSIDLAGTIWECCAFWNTALKMVIGVRSSRSVPFTLYVMDGAGGRPDIQRLEADNHNNCNIAFDSDGRIHIAYDHHDDDLNYRKSTNTVQTFAGEFGAEGSMLGTNEGDVSYPTFFRDPQERLYFMFRSGSAGNGDAYIYRYTTGTGTWAGLGGTTSGWTLNGATGSPLNSPYWNGPPEFTSDWDGAGTGFMYVAWAWRATPSSSESMHDMSVCRWNGLTTWTQTDGSSQTMPVTTANGDVADPFAQNQSYTSFNALVLDSNNRPHLVYCGDDAADSDNNKLWHTYWNGSAWVITAVAGDGTTDFGINGPEVIIDDDDTIRIIVCHAVGIGNDDGISAYVSDGSDWDTWSLVTLSARDTTVVELTHFTGVGGHHDRRAWEEDGIYRQMVPLRGAWFPNADDPSTWGGYIEATADAPAAMVHQPILKIAVDNTETEFWGAVASDGKDVRAFDGTGQQFPVDLAEWNYAGEYALIHVRHYGELSTAPTIRLYVGKPSASAPAADSIFGSESVYPALCIGYWPAGGGTDRTQWDNDFTMTGSPTLGSGNGQMGQSCYEYSGSGQYGISTVVVPTTPPLTLVARGKADNVTGGNTVMSIADAGSTNNYFALIFQGNVAGDPIRANTTATSAVVSDVNGYLADTWHHGAMVTDTPNHRVAVKDGTAGTPETSGRTPAGIDRVTVAVLGRSALDNLFDGEICDLQLWTLSLTTAYLAYESTMGNQATFWNGWTWTAQTNPGARRRRVLLCGSR